MRAPIIWFLKFICLDTLFSHLPCPKHTSGPEEAVCREWALLPAPVGEEAALQGGLQGVEADPRQGQGEEGRAGWGQLNISPTPDPQTQPFT